MQESSFILGHEPALQFNRKPDTGNLCLDACSRRFSGIFIGLIAFGLFHFSLSNNAANAQTVRAKIAVLSTSPARVRIEGESRMPTRDFSFLHAYAGAQGLGQRIENFRAADGAGTAVKVTRLAPGEYVAEPAATKWSYEVDLRPPLNPDESAHVSWLTTERGLLLPKDLLPLPARAEPPTDDSPLEFALSVPAGWRIATVETAASHGRYMIDDWSSSVFFVSADHRQLDRKVESVNLSVTASGTWSFTDQDAADMARDVVRYHQRTVDDKRPLHTMLIVSPYPAPQTSDRWSAETRGRTVVLLAGRVPARVPALGTLSVSLTHEFFHLWIPNGVNLEGDYAWFYEGFTLYQALRCGVALGYFTMGDVLGAIGRSYDAYRRTANFDQLSLVQAGERRWTGGNALIYNKGLLAALLLDANLRMRGKRSLEAVYRDLLRYHNAEKSMAPADSTLVTLLKRDLESGDLIRRLILGSEVIDLRALVAPYGLSADEVAGRTVLSVKGKPAGRQKDLLKGLGYR